MNIVITGASQGIGYATAVELAQNGNHTVVCIARNEQKLNNLKNFTQSINPNAKFIPLAFDLSTLSQSPERITKLIQKHVSKVDVLINNAGLLYSNPLGQLTHEEILSMISINFISPLLLIKHLLPFMSRESHVVNISSMGGFQGSVKFAGLSVYASSKAALASLTENLAEEYKGEGISFNCLALGATDTEMLRTAFPSYEAPLSAEEMARFIAYFALNGAKYFNGKILPVSLSTP